MEQIAEFFSGLFRTDMWPPRWHCGVWSDFHGWVYIISNLLIWFAYFSIPVTLFIILKKKKIPFQNIIFLFMLFILSCGTTHLIDAAIFWTPLYRLNALILAITATVSLITAVVLFKNLPRLLSFKSPEELEQEIANRKNAEKEIRQLNQKLEEKVAKRTEQLSRINKDLEAFTYTVSHDLRTPITGLIGLIELLEKAENDEEKNKIYEKIAYSAKKADTLIADLLLLSKATNSVINKKQIGFRPFLGLIINDLKTNKVIDEHISIAIEGDANIYGDPVLVEQVIVNLISNSVKYKKPNEDVVIRISVEEKKENHQIAVTDNGIGFDMKHHDTIFGTFSRLQTNKQKGTGVGLSIVRNIIEKHKGKVWAQSEPDKGATFYFSLPKE